MSNAYLRDTILLRLAEIAPETAEASLDPDADLRQALSLDDADYQGFVDDLAFELGLAIPASDAAQLSTINGAVAYLSAHAS